MLHLTATDSLTGNEPPRQEDCGSSAHRAQIEFTEWTPDGHLRHASYLRLRDDKDPREVVRETEG